jgi:hypothetical protein
MIRMVNDIDEIAGKRSIVHIIVDISLPDHQDTLRKPEQTYQKQLE